VVLRLIVAADGDITRFVVAGDTFVDADAADRAGAGLHVFPGNGYDGQFFWRLAVDPTDWRLGEHHGVDLDTAYRLPRIGYPALAHLAAGGRPGLVAWSLVGVNVVAVGVVAYGGARIARHGGSPAIWGLAVASPPGLVMALGRDLAECVTVACLVGGVAALQARRPVLATAAWSVAVLTREQALVTVAGYAAWRLVRRRPTRPGRDDLPWLVPPALLLGWQVLLWHEVGRLPLASAGGTNLVAPFTALVPRVAAWATGDLARPNALAPVQLAATLVVAVAAVRAARAVPAPDRFTVVALGLAVVTATCLAASIWRDPSDLRHLVDVGVLSWVVLLVARRPPPAWAAGVAGVVWLATAGLRVAII
jgi:hypothetical protein